MSAPFENNRNESWCNGDNQPNPSTTTNNVASNEPPNSYHGSAAYTQHGQQHNQYVYPTHHHQPLHDQQMPLPQQYQCPNAPVFLNPTTGDRESETRNVLPMRPENFQNVYHPMHEQINYNNYELFSNNFVPHNMFLHNQNQQQHYQQVQNQLQARSIAVDPRNMHAGQQFYHQSQAQPQHLEPLNNFNERNENVANVFINKLINNWTPNTSGTYSPFGEPNQSSVSTIHNQSSEGFIQANYDSTAVQMTPTTSIASSEESTPILVKNKQYNSFPANISNGSPNSNATNGNFMHENFSKHAENKKQRIIAEVKPVRMSYSDVLSKNVSISTGDTNSENTKMTATTGNGSSVSPITVQSGRNMKQNVESKSKLNLSEKKNGSSSDEREHVVKQKKGNTVAGNKPRREDQSVNRDAKESAQSGDDDSIKTNQDYGYDARLNKRKTVLNKTKKNLTSNVKVSLNKVNISGGNNSGRSIDNSLTPEKENDNESTKNGFFYNVTKNDSSYDKPTKQYLNGSSKSRLNKSTSRSSGKPEKATVYTKRPSRSRQNQNYALLLRILDKWLEFTIKVITWLVFLVYDVIVLSFGMIWDRLSYGFEIAIKSFKNLRQDLKANSNRPTAWFKKLFTNFDNRFSKESKWAFWRRIFVRKKVTKPQTQEFYRNGRLPQTGDEAMYSLLNCKGKDAYSILGVTSDCSQELIRKHYKKIAVLVHPDKNKQPGAEEAFKILQRAFELIGEPENRKNYDLSLVEAKNAEKAWSELNDLLTQLQTKIAETANTIRCSSCGSRHPRKITGRPHYAARECSSCKIRHSAREGDIWAETSMLGLKWNYLALMEGKVYDVTEWANCQKGALSHLQPNSHIVQYRIVLGGQQQQQQQNQQHEKERLKREPPVQSEQTLDDFLDNLYSRRNPQSQLNQSRRRTRKN